jgi:hypothetical protein
MGHVLSLLRGELPQGRHCCTEGLRHTERHNTAGGHRVTRIHRLNGMGCSAPPAGPLRPSELYDQRLRLTLRLAHNGCPAPPRISHHLGIRSNAGNAPSRALRPTGGLRPSSVVVGCARASGLPCVLRRCSGV